MKYIVQEIQIDGNGNTALTPAVVKEDRNEAYGAFYLAAAGASASSLAKHTVIFVTENGDYVMPSVVFTHGTAKTEG